MKDAMQLHHSRYTSNHRELFPPLDSLQPTQPHLCIPAQRVYQEHGPLPAQVPNWKAKITGSKENINGKMINQGDHSPQRLQAYHSPQRLQAYLSGCSSVFRVAVGANSNAFKSQSGGRESTNTNLKKSNEVLSFKTQGTDATKQNQATTRKLEK